MTRFPEAFVTSSDSASRWPNRQRQDLSDRRRRHERLVELARSLPAADRLLMEQVYLHGLSIADLARLAGCSYGRMRRRLARLVKRMEHPLFRFLIAHGDLLPATTRKVAELMVFHGLSLRRAAKATGQSLHVVRMNWLAIRALARI